MGVELIGNCGYWSTEKYLKIPRPDIVACFNKYMGGEYLSDMLMELYKVNNRSKKWYMRLLVFRHICS